MAAVIVATRRILSPTTTASSALRASWQPQQSSAATASGRTAARFLTSSVFRTRDNNSNNNPNPDPKPAPPHTNQNPSYPKFNLREIVPNPRVRRWLVAGLVAMALLELSAWVKFYPKIMGGKGGDGSSPAGSGGNSSSSA
ncbi:hypothetical protein B0T26DRAFT_678997 [Lasiosphaeria miniovina]|uniref:Uncharacterized protein n=1 Tax=Lasiosphaeria miniovina TaxID=1954250 RepID=A0AA40A5L5_9PEZI|nr:uncharacterized protein B0T26DRAFT_678997 [Lasiosphaeria miniovina]KAK0709606.1 hypothetical protein B0T26DRAFT_678997 [Lasiosphaeria miniovina]